MTPAPAGVFPPGRIWEGESDFHLARVAPGEKLARLLAFLCQTADEAAPLGFGARRELRLGSDARSAAPIAPPRSPRAAVATGGAASGRNRCGRIASAIRSAHGCPSRVP